MDVVSLFGYGIISTIIISVLLFIAKNSRNQSVRFICGLIIFLILFLDIWPFLELLLFKPITLDSIVELFYNLAAFLVGSIGSAIVYPFLPKRQREFSDQL